MPNALRGFLVSLFLVAVLISIGSPAARAQGRGAPAPPQDFLSAAKNIKCVFSVYTSASWRAGDPQAQVKPTEIVQTFTSIDSQEGTARSNNAATGADIVVRLSAFSLHFLEVTSSGSLKVTTVFNQESRPGKLKGVYTQHDYLRMAFPGFEAQPTVSQYYGECEINPAA